MTVMQNAFLIFIQDNLERVQTLSKAYHHEVSKPESKTQDEAPLSVIFHINEQKITVKNVLWRHIQVRLSHIRCI